MTLLLPLVLVTAVAAAVRSTWSPCGLSMLSSITPLAERARGRRFAWAASWYVVGGALGGASIGLAVAVAAVVVRALGPGSAVVAAAALVAAAVAAGFDAGVLRPVLPHHRRQVNELWLNRFRGWVYGLGFGWQIGTGLATYIMTAAVYLTLVLAALTADPTTAFLALVLFGTVRGLAILLVAGATSPERLGAFHRRFDAAREPVRWAVAAVQAAVAAVAAAALAGPAGAAVVAAGFTLVVLRAVRPTGRSSVAGRPATVADAAG